MSESVLNLIKKYSVPAPERKYGPWWALGDLVLLIAAGNTWVAGAALLKDHSIIALILGFPITIGIGYLSFRFGEHAKRLLVPLAIEVLSKDKRKPVVYLRSFGIDEKFELGEYKNVAAHAGAPSFFVTRSRVEDCLELLNSVGPLIAVGKPGVLPQTGAYRLYIANEHWQQAISALLPHAELVVISWGESAGIEWELKEVLRQAELRSVLFYLPFEDEERFTLFRVIMQNYVKCKLPKLKGNAYFLGFTSNTGSFIADPGELGINKNDPHAVRKASLRSALKRLYPNLREHRRSVPKSVQIKLLTYISTIYIILCTATWVYAFAKKAVPGYMPLANLIVGYVTK